MLHLPKPFLERDGRLWVLTEDAVFDVMLLENRSNFDLTLAEGNRARLKPADLFVSRLAEQTVDLFRPLFAGASISVVVVG